MSGLKRAIAAAFAVAALVHLSASEAEASVLKAVIDNCQNQSLNPDDRIAACTQLVHSNLFLPHFRAVFLVHRALAYRQKGDTADEVQDIVEALKLNPDDSNALMLRDEINSEHPGAIPVQQ